MGTWKRLDLGLGLLLAILLLPAEGYAGQFSGQQLPLPVQAVLARINPLIQKKAYPQAIEILLEFQSRGGSVSDAGQADPNGYHHPQIDFVLGNCQLMRGQHEAAAAAYRRVVARDPDHTFAWLNLAKACYELKRYAEAGRCFSRGYQTEGEKNPESLYFSAAAYMMAEDHLHAIDLFERLFTIFPEAVKPEWKEYYVHALLAVDQPRRALPIIQELARTYSGEKKSQWQEILLYHYVQLGMDTEALELVRMLTGEHPTVAKWWKALAHIHLNAGRYEAALSALTVYAFITPLSLEEQRLLADLNLQLGIPVKSVPLYEACLKAKPDKAVLQHLVLAYQQLGRPETALRRLEAFQTDPDDADLMVLKAELLYTLKNYDAAAAAYRRAAQYQGRHAGRAWLMAGYAAWQMNDIPASRDAFAKAGTYNPEKKAADAALRQLARVAVE